MEIRLPTLASLRIFSFWKGANLSFSVSLSFLALSACGIQIRTLEISALTIDTTAPDAPIVALASANPTGSIAATLTVASCIDRVKIYVSESATAPAFNAAGWQTCSTGAGTTTMTLSSGAGTKTLYAFAQDTAGNISTSNSVTVDLVVATHQGWSGIKATGSKTPVTQSGLATAPATATLTWNAATVSSGTITSYNIYRALTSGAQDYTSPLATGIVTGTRSYPDTSVTNGATYYYTIAPVISGLVIIPTAVADSEIKIIVPPANMVLLHRWVANQEICGLMGRTVDRANDYRCPYVGPGGTGTYYDTGRSTFVDTYELGCNYTPAPGCGDATNGCLGTADPTGVVGNINDVFYNRTSGSCFVKTAAATWISGNTSGLSAAFRLLLASNKPGLPPLVMIDQNRSYETCQARSESGFAGNKKLLTHQQHVIASAWDSSLADATITTIENGSSLPTSGNCNSNSGSGLTFDNLATPADLETLPGTLAGSLRSVRTGGTSTQNCVSRYGAQDLVGNVWEWNSDQLGACSAITYTCVGATSTLDTTNTDWNGLHFDGAIAPGAGGSAITEWRFSAMSFSATRFLVPLGIPMVGSSAASWDSLAIGIGIGQFDPAKFHSDNFWLYTNRGFSQRGADAGGGWEYGTSLSGRFTLSLYDPPTYTYRGVGLRCALPAE